MMPTRRSGRSTRAVRLAGLAGLAALAVALGCATNPVTGRKEISFVSEAQERTAGEQTKQAIAQEYGDYDHAGWAAHIDSLGRSLARVSHRPDLAWEFHVLDDPAVNAFAAPGGFIYVTRGILGHLESEAQLAGVVGHEIGHDTARHYARSVSRQQIAGLGLAVGSIFSETLARYGQLAQQGLSLLFLKYSRDQENEADRLGVDYSVAAGYDAREMPATYAMLARISARAGSRLPTYLSTHPDPGDREATVRALAATATAGRSGLVVRHDAFLRMLDGVVYGDDPRQGYFEGARFYHPAMRFTVDFPAGWKTQNSKAAVLAATADQASVVQLTLAAAGSATPAQFADQVGRQPGVVGVSGRAERIHGYEAWAGRLTVTDDQGRQGTLAAVFIRQAPQAMFQFLGQVAPGSAAEAAFLAAARSFAPLTETARLNPRPARIQVVAAPAAGTFRAVIAGLGAQGADVEETAILNGLAADEPVERGRLLKVVRPAQVR
jgi:predicted Zn-dependent protease